MGAAVLIVFGPVASSSALRHVSATGASADLAVALKPSSAHPASHSRVRFVVTVTDRGPDGASGLRISFVARGGLSHPRLVSAPPDTLGAGCLPTAPGAPPDCISKAVPPVCHTTATTLTCSYTTFSIEPAGPHGRSLTIVISALTAGRGRETAVAGVSSTVVDPAPADNHASTTLRVGAASTPRRSRPGGPAPVVVGKTFKPRVGDWDGTADGFPASFQLLQEPSYPSRYARPPYGFEDVVLYKPDACPLNPYASFQTTEQPGVTPVDSDGSLGLASDGIFGGLTGTRSALLSSAFTIPGVPGAPGCKGTLRWHMHPATRRAVNDGVWTLDVPGALSSTFTVSAGGRLADNLALPGAIAGACGGASGGVDLFVAPNGVARWTDPQQPGLRVTLTFTGRRSAGGQVTLTPVAPCTPPVVVTMTASWSRATA